MLYAENIGLRDCSGFLQIGSHFMKYICTLKRQLNSITKILLLRNFNTRITKTMTQRLYNIRGMGFLNKMSCKDTVVDHTLYKDLLITCNRHARTR